MTYEEALRVAMERDMTTEAAVYAINSLLIYLEVYSAHDFRKMFTEYVEKNARAK